MTAVPATKRAQLVVVVVSGAHATGKSSLLLALADLLEQQGEYVYHAPNFTAVLTRFWTSGRLASAPPYVPINELDAAGYRAWFQTQLPEALAYAVEESIQAISEDAPSRVVLLVERWFADILAMTRILLPRAESAPTRDQIRETCYARHEQTMDVFSTKFDLVSFLPVFIPLAACDEFYEYGGDAAAMEYAETFEALCLDEWSRVTGHLPAVTVSSPDLSTRVLNVLMSLSQAKKNINGNTERTSS